MRKVSNQIFETCLFFSLFFKQIPIGNRTKSQPISDDVQSSGCKKNPKKTHTNATENTIELLSCPWPFADCATGKFCFFHLKENEYILASHKNNNQMVIRNWLSEQRHAKQNYMCAPIFEKNVIFPGFEASDMKTYFAFNAECLSE